MALSTAAGLALAGTAVLIASIVADPMIPARFLAPSDPLRPADAALVFSGDPGYERTLEAARLYREGYARYVVFSGRGGPGDSGESMARSAREAGVPAQAILLEQRAANTYENVLFVRGLLVQHQVRTLLLVTSPYHQRRAYLVARHLLPGMTLLNHPVPHSAWRPEGWWRSPPARAVVVGEYLKMGAYLMMGRL